MGASEFAAWRAYLEVEPMGAPRDDLHAAMLLALLANVNRDRKKRPKPFTLQEFMPDFWKRPDTEKKASAAEIMAKFKLLTG